MKGMMKGNKPPIVSRMDFHYDFILKTIQSATDGEPLKWLTIMEQSYWFQQRQNQIKSLKVDIAKCQKKLDEMKVEEPFFTGCELRFELEYKIKQTVNAERKEVQKKLDALKNKQLGPKWTTAWTNYNLLSTVKKEYYSLIQDLHILESHQDSIKPAVKFLYEIGYLKNDDPLTLKNEDMTLKGILATEVNEGHQILMTEMYTKEMLNTLSGEDIVSVLACFHEEKETEDSPSIHELNVSLEVKDILKSIKDLANNLQSLEDKIGYPVQDYWRTSTQMIEPMRRWIDGENASIICQEHGLFEGNFIRNIMKMTNMLDELLAMATYCQNVEQVNKIMEVRQKMIRDIVISDSLYLHL
jgi:superfamily II RNA helicase